MPIAQIDIEEDSGDDDLYVTVSIAVDKGQTPLRVDKFIISHSHVTSRSKVQDAAKAGALLVNDEPVKSNYKVRPLDQITLTYPKSVHTPDMTPENIPLEIVYEDDDLLVVNKPAGLVVHPGVGNINGTLVNALLYHIQDLPGESSERAGLVHRIDKNTSGLLVVAKTAEAMAHLAKQFFNRTINRRYIA
jgi:23S rRNA pseudouridine1911/1915/1917 synthase